jgi:hypothetical protein
MRADCTIASLGGNTRFSINTDSIVELAVVMVLSPQGVVGMHWALMWILALTCC